MYDGANKGLRLATGEIIVLLNADDLYAGPNIIFKVLEAFDEKNVDSCYGDLVYVDKRNTDKIFRYWQPGSYDYRRFFWGWMPPHPTFFVRKRVYEKHGLFNPGLGSSADYELMIRFLLKNRISTTYLPEIVVKMRTGGISNASLKNRLWANYNDRLAWKVNSLKPYPWTLLLKPLSKMSQYYRKP